MTSVVFQGKFPCSRNKSAFGEDPDSFVDPGSLPGFFAINR